jgi:hypothetical protein
MTSITQLYATNVAAKEAIIFIFSQKILKTSVVLLLQTRSPKVTNLDNFDTSCDILKYHRRFVPQKHFTNNITK